MNHLYTLQILALTCPDIFAQAVEASPAGARAVAAQLLKDRVFMENDARPVLWWFSFIQQYTVSPSLRTIYKQLAHMLQWGHLLLFYRQTNDKVAHIRLLSRRVIERIASNDTQGVGSAAAAYYYYLFDAVRQSVARRSFLQAFLALHSRLESDLLPRVDFSLPSRYNELGGHDYADGLSSSYHFFSGRYTDA